MGIENGSTNRWKTARERNRLKARYLIQSRVTSRVNDNIGSSTRDNGDGGLTANSVDDVDCNISSTDNRSMYVNLEEANIIITYLRSIVTNGISAFSIAAMARHGHLLNGPLPSAAVSSIPSAEEHVDLDSSTSEGTCGASPPKDASRYFSTMLSTELPWERNQQSNSDVINTAKSTTDDRAQLSESTTVIEPDESLPSPSPQLQVQPTTLATSKYGPEYVAKRVVPYMKHLRLHELRQLSTIEYASLLGRHGIVQQLLLGGLDPTIGSVKNTSRDKQIVDDSPAELASRRVLAFFHSIEKREEATSGTDGDGLSHTIPLSMWSYIVRAVIEMRMNGILDGGKEGNANPCALCNREVRLLQFGAPCCHTYCEPCMWNHLIDQVPLCTSLRKNVISCPICGGEFRGFRFCERDQHVSKANVVKKSAEKTEEKKEDGGIHSRNDLPNAQQKARMSPIDPREQRRLESLDKFMALPSDSAALKLSKRKKRKKDRDSAHGTWEAALRPFIQVHQSREVRSDRFFKAVLSSFHLTIGYLDSGIDVNIKNDYGQTPLYMACWKGSIMVAQLLLDYGADLKIAANGGSTCYSVAMKYRRTDVLNLLEKYSLDTDLGGARGMNIPLATPSDTDDYQVSILIDPVADHPGAGACFVDNALSDAQLHQLEALRQLLPVADEDDDNGRESANHNSDSFKRGKGKRPVVEGDSSTSKKSSYRPTRSYFCDAEEEIQTMLQGCVHAARMALASSKDSVLSSTNNPNENGPPSSVFKHMRFLNYEKPGGFLPPHVDLCRVDDASGCRSTHTFILYLTECENSGGTALLKQLKDPKVLAVTQPKRGRALMFRHDCPHSGLEVDCSQKVLLRGEVILDLP